MFFCPFFSYLHFTLLHITLFMDVPVLISFDVWITLVVATIWCQFHINSPISNIFTIFIPLHSRWVMSPTFALSTRKPQFVSYATYVSTGNTTNMAIHLCRRPKEVDFTEITNQTVSIQQMSGKLVTGCPGVTGYNFFSGLVWGCVEYSKHIDVILLFSPNN